MRGALYLASTSPRRRQLLGAAGIEFVLHLPGPEPEGEGTPAERAELRARSKAVGAPRPADRGTVLGVDTVVAVDDDELGKPRDREAAGAMLQRLMGRAHQVITGHCVVDVASGRFVEASAVARVRCDRLDEDAVRAYLDGGDWRGKAGGYAIQGVAAAFVVLLDGELDTVIGLNVATVRRLLREVS